MAMVIIIKVIIVILMVFILFSLASAMYYLIKGNGDSRKIVKALTWRIGLSLVLFAFLIFAFAMGWITPHQI